MTMTQATRLLAIRHGETAWNADGRLQGQLDIGLNARGRWQARQLARALADAADVLPLAAVYCSDLQRTQATARPLADALGLPLGQQAALRERGFGVFEGLTFDDISARWPDAAQRWRQREPAFAPDGGGESLLEFRVRVLQAVERLAAAHAGAQIALVVHGGVLDVLYRAATGQELQAPRSWTLDNAAINRLLWTPQGLALVGWADAQHLADEPEHAPDAHDEGAADVA